MTDEQATYPTQKGVVLDPRLDGETHVNVYSKSKCKIGRALSNISCYPILHPVFGRFDTLEGFWWWLSTGMVEEELRTLDGFACRKLGKTLRAVPRKDFKEQIRYALCLKLSNHIGLREAFFATTLPFVHYYAYGKNGKVAVLPANKSIWVVEFLTAVRDSHGELLETTIANYDTGLSHDSTPPLG